jgi:repressor LexA
MQELADELGVSKVTVFEHIEALIKKGAIIRQPNKARSLEINRDFPLPDESRNTRMPLVGTIAAGMPIEAIEERQFLDLEELFISARGGKSDRFVLKVRGDSMIEDHIQEGDFVVCRSTRSAQNGQIVVALLDNGEATLKRFYKEGRKIRLQPANPAFEPIWVDDVKIQGVVIGVVRCF